MTVRHAVVPKLVLWEHASVSGGACFLWRYGTIFAMAGTEGEAEELGRCLINFSLSKQWGDQWVLLVLLVLLDCCSMSWPWQANISIYGYALSSLLVCQWGIQSLKCVTWGLAFMGMSSRQPLSVRPGQFKQGKQIKYSYAWQHATVLLLQWPLEMHLLYPSRPSPGLDEAGMKQHPSGKLPWRLQGQERGKYMRGANYGCHKLGRV